MSGSVRAFQPRKIDPPHFVAEDVDELEEKIGEFVGAEQCDGCGNASYLITKRSLRPGVIQYEAVCMADPDDNPEFRHPDPCGTHYPIKIWGEDLVVF